MYKQGIIDEMHLTKSSDIKQYWKLLKKLDLDNCQTINSAADISPNEWVNHYTKLLQTVNNCQIPENTAESGPLDYEITLEEMTKARTILKPGKATGIDNVNNEMIMEALKLYPSAFLNVLNSLMKEGKGVKSWLTSLLVPIHKKGALDNPENYRGIALISCLAKLFYAILNNRLMDYCLKHNILSPSQLGFLAGNRTSDAHIIIYNLLKVEEEIHFLTKCKILEPIRKPLFDLCEELRPQFTYYSPKEKFVYIMTNPCMMGNVSGYLSEALVSRDIYLEASSELMCTSNQMIGEASN